MDSSDADDTTLAPAVAMRRAHRHAHHDWYGGERWPPGSAHPRPLNRAFYTDVRRRLGEATVDETDRLERLAGQAIDLGSGDVLTLRLVEGPQIVNLWAYNSRDFDERLWVQDMCLIEGLYLTRHSRLWGEMPRYRPLLTMVEDTVVTQERGAPPGGQHHFLFGGGGTPANWRNGGGAAGVPTTYEQFTEVLTARGIPHHLLTDNVCLFQKTAIEPATQRFVVIPSDAVRGSSVSLFAELDVTVVLALSPYLDGARPPTLLGRPSPRAVQIELHRALADPLPWPYPDMPYPDLDLYLDADGTRSDEPVPTPASAYTPTAT